MSERDIINITPESSGVKEVQQKSLELVPVKTELPSEGFPTPSVADVIQNLTDVRGIAGIAFLHTSVRMIESDKNQMQKERDKAISDTNELRDKYHAEEIKSVRLSERLKSAGRMKIIQNIFLTVGGMTGGLSSQYVIDGNNNWAIYVFIISVILLIAGWLWPTQRVEEKK